MGIRNTYRLLVSSPEENKPLGNTRKDARKILLYVLRPFK